jgi:TonB-linked SusC/RagA family outer membrane protein
MIQYNSISRISLLFLFTIICLWGGNLNAQQQATIISGIVADESGKPLEGVVVIDGQGNARTTTGANGEYQILLKDKNDFLTFSSIGYSKEKVTVGAERKIDVRLKNDMYKLDEIVQLGYTSQRRADISGSIATISGDELEKSPVSNLTQSFVGRLSGLITQEVNSELSRANTNLYVRGLSIARGNGPLVMIDGISCAYNASQTLEYISANEIESVTILKDASTQALYGIQGANGLIVVTTKRGNIGKLKINTRFDQSFQQVTTKPTFYNSYEYAELRNQAAYNDGHGKNFLYSPDQIEQYRLGSNGNLYPNNNWYNQFMKDFARMQRLGLNLSGGNDKVQYFSDINLMHQGGQFETDQTKYNPNPNNTWINYRSNVDVRINEYLGAFVKLSGNIKRERTPGYSEGNVYSSLFQIPSNVFGPLTPQVLDPTTGKILDEGSKVIATERVASPTYGMLNRSGYFRHTTTNTTSQFGLNLDMGFVTKGLNLTGVMAYQTNSAGSLGTTQNFERWMKSNDPKELTFIKKGTDTNTPLVYSKGHSFYYHLTYILKMDYARDFGKHSVTGMAYTFYQNLTKADNTSPWCLPYNRLSSGIEATYGYDGKYLAKLDAGYSGSEQYASGSRFTLTPAISLAWVASKEGFAGEIDWLSNLKFRGSYGKTANDINGLARYAYLDNVTVSRGGPIGYLQYVVSENQVGNPEIKAEISTKQNFGVDLGLFNSLSFSFDVFKERTENMVVSANSVIPLYQGIPLGNYPKTNSGTFENSGYDISANYFKSINNDLSFNLGGFISYAKNKIVNWNEVLKSEDYAYRKWEEGYSYGQEFGYLVDYSNGNGFFNSQAEIQSRNLAYGFGTPRIGDLIYRDLNKDGKIDERDKAPIGNGALPRLTYSFSGNVKYKSFELSLLFQGIGEYSSIYGSTGVWETSYDGVYGALHQNAWTPERFQNGEKITYPALSLAKTVNHESNDYFSYNRSYLRLKNVELSYALPTSLLKKISAHSAKIIVSGQNIFTWDKMKSDDFGPEGSYSAFPAYRVYNMGISVSF